LEGEDFLESFLCQSEEGLEFFPAKIVFFPACLYFYQATCSRHDDVHIDLGIPILGVVQVEEWEIVQEADTDRSNGSAEGIGSHFSGKLKAFDGTAEGKAGASDGGSASSAIGRENIAVDP
jgi:hypothetical protein